MDAPRKCALPAPPARVRPRGGKCVVSAVSVVDPDVGCSDTADDPLTWVLDAGAGECVATVVEDYEVQVGERRVPPLTERVRVAPFTEQVRVAPFTERVLVTERVRVAPFTEQVRIPPYRERFRVAPFTARVRVPPLTERVRVAPFTERARVAPFTRRVRVAPFTKVVTSRVPYTYTAKVRDRCLRYYRGHCISWSYKYVKKTGYRTLRRTVAAYNYETRAAYNYKNRTVFNYETRAVFNYETRTVYNYEWRDLFVYRTRDVFNHEDRQVYRTRDVYNYEDRDVFNYQDQEVFNYEPVYETRQRKVQRRKDPVLSCSGDYSLDRTDNKCKKTTETVTDPAVAHCEGIVKASLFHAPGKSLPITYTSTSWALVGGKCHRDATTPAPGCPVGYKKVTLKDGSYCRHLKASPFGTTDIGTLEPGLAFAADSVHTYRAIETNATELAQWQPYDFKTGGDDVYAATDITVRAAVAGETADVVWEVKHINEDEPDLRAWHLCRKKSSNGTVCNSGEIEIDDDAYADLSELLRRNLVCHELAHSIGFNHGESQTSCMNSGNNNLLDAWETMAIALQY